MAAITTATNAKRATDSDSKDEEEAGLAAWLALSEQIATALDPKVSCSVSRMYFVLASFCFRVFFLSLMVKLLSLLCSVSCFLLYLYAILFLIHKCF